MSEDRDDAQTRKNIDSTARAWQSMVNGANGNDNYTFDQAKRRVANARRNGDMKRDNRNR
jgi:hypothetical protein